MYTYNLINLTQQLVEEAERIQELAVAHEDKEASNLAADVLDVSEQLSEKINEFVGVK